MQHKSARRMEDWDSLDEKGTRDDIERRRNKDALENTESNQNSCVIYLQLIPPHS